MMGIEKLVEVEAELMFRDSNNPVRSFLLGVDGKLYGYNDLDHHLHPFNQKAKYEVSNMNTPTVEYVLNHSIRTNRDGTTVDNGYYYGTKK